MSATGLFVRHCQLGGLEACRDYPTLNNRFGWEKPPIRYSTTSAFSLNGMPSGMCLS